MSGICAAGTGAFLDSVAARLNVPVEQLAEHVNYDRRSSFLRSARCLVQPRSTSSRIAIRLGDVIAAACRAEARTIVSGVGDLFLDYSGPIVFQGGVASNRAVAHYLQAITGNRILIPELNQVMGALGRRGLPATVGSRKARASPWTQASGPPAVAVARTLPGSVGSVKKSVAMRTLLRGSSSSPAAMPPWYGGTCSILRRSSTRWVSAC